MWTNNTNRIILRGKSPKWANNTSVSEPKSHKWANNTNRIRPLAPI